MTQPGNLDQRITIQRRVETADGAGGVTLAWADLTTVWANIKAKAGREAMTDGRMAASFVTVFTIRQIADLTDVDRIAWGGVTYNIRSVLRESGRDQYLRIEAERGAAN